MTFALIKEYVSEGETENAVEHFLALAKTKYQEYENDILLLSGKFKNWKREKILGIGENEQKEWSKINYSILQLISLIEYENKDKERISSDKLEGYILVRYWSNKKWKDDYTINDDENENLNNISELKVGSWFIVKYSYGANLRAFLPPKEGYSNRTIKETTLICNLKQGTKVKILEPIYQYSENDYWAKVQAQQE